MDMVRFLPGVLKRPDINGPNGKGKASRLADVCGISKENGIERHETVTLSGFGMEP